MRVTGAVKIARQRHELGAGPGALLRICDRLVAIADAVDEPRRLCLAGDEGSTVDQRGDLRLRQLAGAGDPANDLPGGRAQQILDLLALWCGHRGFGEGVHRGLVFLAMGEAGDDAESVERAAKKRAFAVQPDQPERSERLQPDLIERGGEIIGPGGRAELAEAVGEGDGELPFRTKIADRVTQFLAGGKAERVAPKPGV